MKKIIVILFTLLIICSLIIYLLLNKYNTKKLVTTIEKQTGLIIILSDENVWNFYPNINFVDSNVSIKNKDSSLIVQNANIFINKSYWPLSPIFISINTPTINYVGMEMRDVEIQAKYLNNIILIENLTGKIIEGILEAKGSIELDDKQPFSFQGQFKNISLNTLLKQSQVATWQRVSIKLSSPNFNITGQKNSKQNILTSLKGTLPIKGSLYFTSTSEDRFGAALLSLLAEKIPDLSSVSQSVNFLLSTYANVPSSINGTLTLKEGLIDSEKILIKNEWEESTLEGFYNILNNTLDGTLYFFQENEIFLEASLQGDIENPQILVAGKVFSDQNEQSQDIKQLIEKGLNSFIEKLLSNNE